MRTVQLQLQLIVPLLLLVLACACGRQAIGMKKLSILLGTGGQLALSAGYWGYITPKILYAHDFAATLFRCGTFMPGTSTGDSHAPSLRRCYLGVGLGTAHFFTMVSSL